MEHRRWFRCLVALAFGNTCQEIIHCSYELNYFSGLKFALKNKRRCPGVLPGGKVKITCFLVTVVYSLKNRGWLLTSQLSSWLLLSKTRQLWNWEVFLWVAVVLGAMGRWCFMRTMCFRSCPRYRSYGAAPGFASVPGMLTLIPGKHMMTLGGNPFRVAWMANSMFQCVTEPLTHFRI